MKRICSVALVIIMLSTIILSGCNSRNTNDKSPLSTPTNLSIQGSLLSWGAVENAIGYTVKVGNQTANCNNAQFELAQLSLTSGEYSVMVKARGGDDYLDSDYSVAIKYTCTDANSNSSGSSVNTATVDVSFAASNDRYSPVSAPIINNAPPLIASSTDYTFNYFLVDGGYIKNTPISSGLIVGYNGQTPMTVRFEKSTVTTNSVEESLSKTISESVSETRSGSASINISYETGSLAKLLAGKISVGAEYSRQWGTTTENSNSTSSTYTVANEVAESLTQSIEYTIGENNEAIGDYRLSMVTTCDIYYLITTTRDNTELKEIKMVLCARPDVRFILEYSANGIFGKTSNAEKLDWPENFYQNYEMPTDALACKITLDVDGGYALAQNTVSLYLGKNYSLEVPIRYNYAFVGWYSAQNGQGKKYTDSNGKLYEAWSEPDNKTLYACWTPISNQITEITQMQLSSQQTYSAKSAAFSFGLDIAKLKEAGYSKLNISISGACSGYDYHMNERGRYFVLSDAATNTDLINWAFKVKGFGGVEAKTISLNNLNANGQYKLQLVSDYSEAYDEKLVVSGLVITVTATK